MAGTKTKETNVDTVKVKLPRIKGAEDPVFVRVNDYTCYIKRGTEVEVPDFVAVALQNQEMMLEQIYERESALGYED